MNSGMKNAVTSMQVYPGAHYGSDYSHLIISITLIGTAAIYIYIYSIIYFFIQHYNPEPFRRLCDKYSRSIYERIDTIKNN